MEVEIETLAQQFIRLGLDSSLEILDVACKLDHLIVIQHFKLCL